MIMNDLDNCCLHELSSTLTHSLCNGGNGVYCPQCGKDNEASATYCIGCGKSLGSGGSEDSFWNALFDFSFTEFATPKLIRIIYVIELVLFVILAVLFVIVGFASDPALGAVFLVLSPIALIFWVILFRITGEMQIIIFRMAEDIKKLADKNDLNSAGD